MQSNWIAKLNENFRGNTNKECTLQNKHECKIFPFAIEKCLNDLEYAIKAYKNLICKLFDCSIIKISMQSHFFILWNLPLTENLP